MIDLFIFKKKPVFSRKHFLLIVFFLFVLVINLAVYRNALGIGFLSDDYHMLRVVSELEHPIDAFRTNIEGTRSGSSYGPIFTLAVYVGYHFFGLNALPYHFIMILVHVVVAFFVGLITYRFTKKCELSLFSVVVFSLLHTRVEVLFWLSSFPHLFGTGMMVASLYAFLKFTDKDRQKDRRKVLWYILSLITFLLGLFTKEVIIMLPVVFAFIVWSSSQKMSVYDKLRSVFVRLFPYVVGLISYLLLRTRYTGGAFTGYGDRGIITNPRHLMRLFTEISVGSIFPQPLRDMAGGWFGTHAFLLMMIVVGVFYFSFRYSRYRDVLIFSFVSYLIMIQPFLQLMMNPVNDEGDRYTYLVSVFVAIFISTILFYFYEYRRLPGVVIILALLSYQIYFVGVKVVHWQDADVLARRVLASMDEVTDGEETFVVGLPDNVSGAQVFRNAFAEALFLTRGVSAHIEIIPLYTMPRDLDSGRVFIEKIDKNNYKLRALGGVYSFTGFPVWERGYGIFSLDEFVLRGHLGRSVDIHLDEKLDGFQSFFYVDGGKLTRILVE